MTRHWDEAKTLELVRRLVAQELRTTAPVADDQDLVKAGLIDSMGWVGILSGIEEATGLSRFGGAWPETRPQSIRALVETLQESGSTHNHPQERADVSPHSGDNHGWISLAGWGSALGSLHVSVEEVERQCGLAPGTIRDGAGIESVCQATGEEDELVLGTRAAASALELAETGLHAVDFVVATSSTFLAFPSLAASLHSRLLLQESCGAIDVGGACVGLIQALATAKALLARPPHGSALVVAAEVHSRRLLSPGVPPEFRGLFGDGACAFVLQRSNSRNGEAPILGDFVWGCSGAFAASLRLSLADSGELQVGFKGEQLASAAVSTLHHVLGRLESASGHPRSEVRFFALHQPNPRVTRVLAQRTQIPPDRIPLVSRTTGNLGSATCGVSLCEALDRIQGGPPSRRLVFVAAVGPGLIWGGTWVEWPVPFIAIRN